MLVCLETVSRSRRRDQDHIPVNLPSSVVYRYRQFLLSQRPHTDHLRGSKCKVNTKYGYAPDVFFMLKMHQNSFLTGGSPQTLIRCVEQKMLP